MACAKAVYPALRQAQHWDLNDRGPLAKQVVVMLRTVFVFLLVVPIAIIGLVAAALPMAFMVTFALDFALTFTFDFAFPFALDFAVAIAVPVSVMVSSLIAASFPVSIVMSGGVASVTVLGHHRKACKRAGPNSKDQGPCKLP